MAGGKYHQWKQRKHFAFGSREEIRGGGSPALSSGPLSSGPAALKSAVLRVQWDTGPRRVSRDARIPPPRRFRRGLWGTLDRREIEQETLLLTNAS